MPVRHAVREQRARAARIGERGRQRQEVQAGGVWPASPTSYAISIKCTAVTEKVTLKVQAAPPENSAVGLGAQTQQSLVDQFSGDYNATLTSTTQSHLYNWDAINPVHRCGWRHHHGQEHLRIVRPPRRLLGRHHPAGQVRPDQRQQVLLRQLGQLRPAARFQRPGVRSRRRRVREPGRRRGRPGPPRPRPTRPKTLTPTQLNAIYTCSDTNWDQVGGKNAPIQPFLPQSGAGTLTFWLAAIGVTTPGPCVSNDSNTLEENEGVNPVLQTPEAIWIYSVGDYIAQKFHSAACTNSGCTGTPPCAPAPGKNDFGCNEHGTYTVKEINGIAPTTGSGTATVINTSFPSTFLRTLFEVVPYDSNTSDHIPGSESGAPGGVDLENIFGASGWACTSATAKADIKNYGFVPLSTCGLTS